MARLKIQINLELLQLAQEYLRVTAKRQPPRNECVLAWRHFYQECERLIQRYARVYVRGGDALEDCKQSVWLYLVNNLVDFEYDPQRGEFTTWLYRIVRSATVNYFRYESRYRTVGNRVDQFEKIDEQSDPFRQLLNADSQREVALMMRKIRRNVSRPNYELLRQRWLEGRSVTEVADAMGISDKQVWYREHRARMKCRELFMDGQVQPSPAPVATASSG
ncbi:MAG: sigma-70 family RNA polymerase sigma factor [Phycisphaeraceae bacterium]|nr:sigma-70 family RNA polymerase sigma factor [Phycisphaeraceae bacterium]